jgi:hypothetical protein
MASRVKVRVEAEPRFWAHVPSAFQSGRFADRDAWIDDILLRYRTARRDAEDRELGAVRSFAGAALDDLAPGAAFGLLFLPHPAPAAALVHVEVGGPHAAGADLRATLLAGIPMVRQPDFEQVEVPGIGSGISARFLVARPGALPEAAPLAGIGYLVHGDRCSIRVTTSPTTTTMAGLIDGPLRAIVASLGIDE